MSLSEDRSEIAFFDVETTVPNRSGQGYAILEFGAILVCPRKFVELQSYSTLVRPSDLSLIPSRFDRYNGISRDTIVSAPTFNNIADWVYDILHGRIWAGHNILRFDCARIREAFGAIGRPAPEPKGTIDSLELLTERFGRRAGDMKMATLAAYFGLGKQAHRSLNDVRMNLEVLKCCATVLFVESSLPETNSWVQSNSSRPDPFNIVPLSAEIAVEYHQSNVNMEEKSIPESPDVSSTPATNLPNGSSVPFLVPDEVSISFIRASHVPFYRGSLRMKLLHKDVTLKLQCSRLKVRFGISAKFVDPAGRPRLNFVVDAPPNLYELLDSCDNIARKSSLNSGSSSEWRPVVTRKNGFFSFPTVRLQ